MPSRRSPLPVRARRTRRASAVVLVSFLAVSPGARTGEAATAPGPRCDKEQAEKPFVAAMEQYGRRRYKEAIPGLEDAEALCPAPPGTGPWLITVQTFAQYSYLPFYYLGKCHRELKDLPAALRHFYLSSCFDEPGRDKENTADLGSLTEECRHRIESKERPVRHPYFSAGVAAAQQQRWDEAAEKMWDSLQVWGEDGRTTYSSGRWPDPYLPRFRLAEALVELGCYREACDQLDKSALKGLRTKEVEPERQRLEKLQSLCESKRRERSEEDARCRRWQCWLQPGRPKAR